MQIAVMPVLLLFIISICRCATTATARSHEERLNIESSDVDERRHAIQGAQGVQTTQKNETCSNTHLQEMTVEAVRKPTATSVETLRSQVASIGWATGMLLAINVNDIVWLLPFLITERWRKFAVVYILAMELLVAISWLVSGGLVTITSTITHSTHLSLRTHQLIRLFCSVVVCSYALHSFFRATEDTENANAAVETKAEDAAAQTATVEGNADDGGGKAKVGRATVEKIEKMFHLGYGDLALVAILSSLDSICLYIPMISSGTLHAIPHLIGTFFTALVIVAITAAVGSVPWVKTVVEKVPFWLIMVGISVYLVFSAFYMEGTKLRAVTA